MLPAGNKQNRQKKILRFYNVHYYTVMILIAVMHGCFLQEDEKCLINKKQKK